MAGCTGFAPHTTESVANMELLRGPFRQVSSQMDNLTALSCQTEGTYSQQADKNSHSEDIMTGSIKMWGSHSSVVDDSILLGCDAVLLGERLPTFRKGQEVQFMDFLNLENGTDMLSRNVGKELQLDAA